MRKCISIITLSFMVVGSFCLSSTPTLCLNDNTQQRTAKTQRSKKLTLKQAQEIALQQHPEIMSSDFQTQAADQFVDEEEANLYPQVAGAAIGAAGTKNPTRLTAQPDILNSSGVYNRGSYGVAASQLITDFGRTDSLVGAAQSTRNAREARSLFTRDRVIYIVTRSYFNVLRAQKLLEVAEFTLKARQKLFEEISALRKFELKSDLDVSLAMQNVDDAKLLILKSQNELDDAFTELSEALGYSDRVYFELTDEKKALPEIPDLENSLKKAASINPEIQELKAKVSAARKNYDAAQAAFYPTVKAIGFAGENPGRNKQLLPSNYAAAGVNLSVPIYTGGKLTAAEKRALCQAQALEKDLKNKENQLLRDVRIAWNSTQTTFKNITVTKEFLENSNKSLELMTELYKVGKNSIVDLTQAQLMQTHAAITVANATYDFLINFALLKSYFRESIA